MNIFDIVPFCTTITANPDRRYAKTPARVKTINRDEFIERNIKSNELLKKRLEEDLDMLIKKRESVSNKEFIKKSKNKESILKKELRHIERIIKFEHSIRILNRTLNKN